MSPGSAWSWTKRLSRDTGFRRPRAPGPKFPRPLSPIPRGCWSRAHFRLRDVAKSQAYFSPVCSIALGMARSTGAMHVATIRRRHGERVYVSHLIARRSVRDGKRVRHETIANVSKLPLAALEALRRALAGETLVGAEAAFEIERSLPHGHVAAVLAAMRRLEVGRLLDRAPSRERSLVVAMVAGRLLGPSSPASGRSGSRRWRPSSMSQTPMRMSCTGH